MGTANNHWRMHSSELTNLIQVKPVDLMLYAPPKKKKKNTQKKQKNKQTNKQTNSGAHNYFQTAPI